MQNTVRSAEIFGLDLLELVYACAWTTTAVVSLPSTREEPTLVMKLSVSTAKCNLTHHCLAVSLLSADVLITTP
jgi:hypothetical protein